jgi:hypothetical protein
MSKAKVLIGLLVTFLCVGLVQGLGKITALAGKAMGKKSVVLAGGSQGGDTGGIGKSS